MSGTTGHGIGDDTMNHMSGDMVFHLDLTAVDPSMPGYAAPQNGATVAGGAVELNWTNLVPTAGSDVYVDVWFGSDPDSDFAKIVDAGLNVTSVTVDAAADGRYYWQIDSYLDGSPGGSQDGRQRHSPREPALPRRSGHERHDEPFGAVPRPAIDHPPRHSVGGGRDPRPMERRTPARPVPAR